MPRSDEDSVSLPPKWIEEAHLASLGAMRSATRLRLAKAVLLLSVAGALVSVVVVPYCLDRPRKWFGIEFGPVVAADVRVSMMSEQLNSSEDGLTKLVGMRLMLDGLQRRMELIDRKIDLLERRCLIDSRPITIAHESAPAVMSDASRVALLQVQPTAFNEYGVMTSFAARWLYPDDLETPYVILRGAPGDTTDLRFELTWIGVDGGTVGRTTSVFTKTAGRWDKLAQGAMCAEVNSEIEKLGRFRIQIENR